MRSRAAQAFWAMHVEALNWSGMSVREYATALRLSPTSLRKWRDRFDDGEGRDRLAGASHHGTKFQV